MGKPIASLRIFQGGRLSRLVRSIQYVSNFHAKGNSGKKSGLKVVFWRCYLTTCFSVFNLWTVLFKVEEGTAVGNLFYILGSIGAFIV